MAFVQSRQGAGAIMLDDMRRGHGLSYLRRLAITVELRARDEPPQDEDSDFDWFFPYLTRSLLLAMRTPNAPMLARMAEMDTDAARWTAAIDALLEEDAQYEASFGPRLREA